ncbi:hypothetical protein ABK040_003549 [Willaertia magna]
MSQTTQPKTKSAFLSRKSLFFSKGFGSNNDKATSPTSPRVITTTSSLSNSSNNNASLQQQSIKEITYSTPNKKQVLADRKEKFARSVKKKKGSLKLEKTPSLVFRSITPCKCATCNDSLMTCNAATLTNISKGSDDNNNNGINMKDYKCYHRQGLIFGSNIDNDFEVNEIINDTQKSTLTRTYSLPPKLYFRSSKY